MLDSAVELYFHYMEKLYHMNLVHRTLEHIEKNDKL